MCDFVALDLVEHLGKISGKCKTEKTETLPFVSPLVCPACHRGQTKKTECQKNQRSQWWFNTLGLYCRFPSERRPD